MKKVFLSILVIMLLVPSFAQEKENSLKQSIDFDVVKFFIDETSFSYVREVKDHHIFRAGIGYQYMNPLGAGFTSVFYATKYDNYFHYFGPTIRGQYAYKLGKYFYIGVGGVAKFQYYNNHKFYYGAYAYNNPVSFKEDYRGIVYGPDLIIGLRNERDGKNGRKFIDDFYLLIGYRWKNGVRHIHSVTHYDHMYDQSWVSEGDFGYWRQYWSVGFGVRIGYVLCEKS